jgi:hypothetical protein
MNTTSLLALAALCITLTGPAAAQTGPGTGPGARAGMPGASAPGMGRGGMGMGRGGMAGPNYTPGWSLMTPQERSEHQARMQGMKTAEECRAYRDEHHQQMAERAKAQGGRTLPAPRHDACAGIKP